MPNLNVKSQGAVFLRQTRQRQTRRGGWTRSPVTEAERAANEV
ncbi:hypothetical protein CAMRE0001_2321 [Campylobacter rectus RM3267]|uniref:Uncharacterized protein n=1 Tax=Campylobacter rectus RM3267 TaxID=553218 RepID=B9D5G3_CAMRE|nr:hypothetical protein CAMRE0001_2321 [Campylobacter rectus RM3267]